MTDAAVGDTRAAALVSLEGIRKAYPGVLAVDDVDFDVRRGEVHALLGENGAGKSTLMGLLFGLTSPDAGRILVDGKPAVIRSPLDAFTHGIGFVQQHFSLIQSLTVAENLVLALRSAGRRISVRQGAAKVRELTSRYGLGLEPAAHVEDLSVARQQRLELLKALAVEPKVLILDEPSSLLSPQEAEDLLQVIRRLAADGIGIVLISHKLDEVLSIADRITVLRKGRHVRTLPAGEATEALLGELMIGSLGSDSVATRGQSTDTAPVLEVKDVSAVGDRHEPVLQGVSFTARPGEVVGLAGLEGSGQTHLVEVIAGVRPVKTGAVVLRGDDIGRLSVRQRHARGIAYVPADRRRDGLVGALSVADNLALPNLRAARLAQRGMLRPGTIGAHARGLIERFDVRVPSDSVAASTLSGGNQQKVVLARELSRDPSVILFCYPTWGLDFSAAAAIHREIIERRNRGAAVVLASSDLQELLALSDRILVMQGGRIAGEVTSTATPEDIGRLMGGASVS